MILTGKQVKYRGTVTGLKISAVDGTAFIDAANSSITDLADGNHQIEIYDASNRMLRGVLKAAGTSEGLGGEMFNDIEFADSSKWLASGSVPPSVSGGEGVFSAATNTAGLFQRNDGVQRLVSPIVQDCLYKLDWDITGFTSGGLAFRLRSQDQTATRTSTGTDLIDYLTANSTATGAGVVAVGETTAKIDNVSLKQVTAPSSSGATIVSAKGGDVYNFSYKNPSFTYNAASYYCIVSKVR